MDRSFDLVALLKQHPVAKSHKSKPTQFVSVAGGVQKRLETNIKNRKSSRLSVFDRIRNIPKCQSPLPPPVSDAQSKAEYRKQQLQKWKEEKEQKKKEAAAQKKKPFVTGVTHKPTFGPPPPPKSVPSSSGRVTRSQAVRQQRIEQEKQPKSFAPSNAAFKPPQFKSTEVPTLAPITKKKPVKSKPNMITFEPVLPKAVHKAESSRVMRSKTFTIKPNASDSKLTRKPNDKNKAKLKNPSPKPPLQKKFVFQSSSSSDMEQASKKTTTLPSKATKHSHISSDMRQQNIKRRPQPKISDFQSSSSSDLEIQPNNVMQQSESSEQSEQGTSSEEAITTPRNKTTLPSIATKHSHTSSNMKQQNIKRRPQPKTSNFQSSSSSDFDIQPNNVMKQSESSEQSEQVTSSDEAVTTPRNKIPKSESGSEEKLRSPKSLSMTPEQILEEAHTSPRVTCSRGKDNARKEMKLKIKEGLLDEDNSDMENVNKLRRQLESEIARITGMCDTWDKVFAQTVLPEPVQELVLAAVGQARLLMSQKMQQFASLLERCERPVPGSSLVTPADLQGFWDMVFMQVENVDMRFKKLEELRACDWTEEHKPQPKKAAAKPAAKPAAKKPKPAGGPSRIREMIAAARRAKKDQESQSSTQSDSEKSESSPTECKTFDAGFFSVSSPLKKTATPGPSTPLNKSSLLKTVLSSEARKASVSKNSTSFAMLRASMMSKNVDIEGVSPLMATPPPVNLFATPARSILKQTNTESSRKTEKLKMVLFHESDHEQTESSPLSYSSCTDRGEVNGVGVLPMEGVREEKENTPARRRRSRLTHQNAEDIPSPVMTRSRRKSAGTPLTTSDENVPNRRSSRKTSIDETKAETPKRSMRRRKNTAVY